MRGTFHLKGGIEFLMITVIPEPSRVGQDVIWSSWKVLPERSRFGSIIILKVWCSVVLEGCISHARTQSVKVLNDDRPATLKDFASVQVQYEVCTSVFLIANIDTLFGLVHQFVVPA